MACCRHLFHCQRDLHLLGPSRLLKMASPAPRPRLRVGHSKSRMGCSTCKYALSSRSRNFRLFFSSTRLYMHLLNRNLAARIRRIKCDEARPNCHRCSSTGRRCDGYQTPATKWISVLSGPAASVGSAHPYQYLADDSSRLAFDHFRSRVVVELSRNSDPTFWSVSVLQIRCHCNMLFWLSRPFASPCFLVSSNSTSCLMMASDYGILRRRCIHAR
jgi:hypothetical protein